MAHAFGDYPRLAFAIPLANLSFGAWTDTTYPDAWTLRGSGTAAAWAKYAPGFDLTRAIKLSQTGVPSAPYASTIENVIALPDYIENGQATRLGYCAISDLGGSYGAAVCSAKSFQHDGGGYLDLSSSWLPSNDPDWIIKEVDSSNNITTAITEIGIFCEVRSYNSESDPACVFDCFKVEYGRSVSERYWTFTRFPELSGLDIRPMTFRKDERTGRGSLRSYDNTGGAVKWRIVLPFENVPVSFVEVITEFWRRNRGLDDGIQRPLCLTHCLTDPASSHLSGEDYLKRPPWIICNITNEYLDFKHVGSFLGAGMYSGSLTFEEI